MNRWIKKTFAPLLALALSFSCSQVLANLASTHAKNPQASTQNKTGKQAKKEIPCSIEIAIQNNPNYKGNGCSPTRCKDDKQKMFCVCMDYDGNWSNGFNPNNYKPLMNKTFTRIDSALKHR